MMNLTIEQLQTLKTWLLANSSTLNDQEAADALNESSSDFWVWRTSITTAEIKNVVDWSEYINRSVGERGAFVLLIEDGIVNAAMENIRSGFSDIFSGPQGATTRTALTELAKRLTTVGEQVLSLGTGSSADPANLAIASDGVYVEDDFSAQDVIDARNS